MVGGVLLGSVKVFGSRFPRFCHWWDVKPPRGISFIFQGFRFHLLKLTPFFFFFASKMARGYEVVSNSQAGRRRVTLRETPTASSLVDAMSAEKLRLYNQVPTEISLEILDDPATSTAGEADNAIYFTIKQFVGGLRFLVLPLVK